jgi:hypothetical protein
MTQVRTIQQKRSIRAKVEMQKLTSGSPPRGRKTYVGHNSVDLSVNSRVSTCSVVLGDGTAADGVKTGGSVISLGSIDEELKSLENDQEEEEDDDFDY